MLYKKNSKLSETENLKPFKSCRRPESNRYGYHYPRDFKSRASASSATAAYHYEIIMKMGPIGLEPMTLCL